MSLRSNARTEGRWSKYQVVVDAEAGLWRREDNTVEKNRREDSLLKKRHEGLQAKQFQPTVNISQQVDKNGKT